VYRILRATLAAVTLGAVSAVLIPTAAIGLTCANTPNGAELAIAGGWPQDAPYDYVLIGVVSVRDPIRGDAATWGEHLTVDVQAVLLGDGISSVAKILNPPTGSAGWTPFREGRRFLIAGYVTDDGLTTFLCTPNERITSQARAEELIALARQPTAPDTASRAEADVSPVVTGIGFVVLAAAIAVARRPRPVGVIR
jgi:hypothetical protein